MSTLLLKDDYRDIRKYSDTVSNRLNSHRDNYAPFKAKSGMSRHSAFLFNEDSASSPKAMEWLKMVNPGLPVTTAFSTIYIPLEEWMELRPH